MVGPKVARAGDMVTLKRDAVTATVIAAAIDVHRHLGPGLMESVYKKCLHYELLQRSLQVEAEVPVPVIFKSVHLDCGFRLDMVVDSRLIVEVKSVERLLPVHSAQVITYLRLTAAQQALLINFNGSTLIEGLKSFLGGNPSSH